MSQLRIATTVIAPDELVWSAFTAPDEFSAWFWPERLEPVATLDVHVGGRFHLGSAHEGMAIHGEYQAVELGRRLAFTWRWDGERDETTVDIRFEEVPSGTHLTVVHAGFTDDAVREDHLEGWNDCLARLQPFLDDEAAYVRAPAPSE